MSGVARAAVGRDIPVSYDVGPAHTDIVGHGGVVANVCHGGMASVCHVEVAGLCHGEVASGNYEKKRTLRLVGSTMKYISHSK